MCECVVLNPFNIDPEKSLALETVPQAHIHRFNGHFRGQPMLASCPLDSQFPVVLILSILTGETKSLHRVLRAVPCTLTLAAIAGGF